MVLIIGFLVVLAICCLFAVLLFGLPDLGDLGEPEKIEQPLEEEPAPRKIDDRND